MLENFGKLEIDVNIFENILQRCFQLFFISGKTCLASSRRICINVMKRTPAIISSCLQFVKKHKKVYITLLLLFESQYYYNYNYVTNNSEMP